MRVRQPAPTHDVTSLPPRLKRGDGGLAGGMDGVGTNEKVMLWEVSSGTLKHTISKHAKPVTACAWLPDSQRFVTGGHDRHMYMWDVSGNEVNRPHRAMPKPVLNARP
jgi:WD40 repeat protein